MKKVLFALSMAIITSTLALAAMTPEELRSAENLKNAGYSDDTIKLIQINANEYEPKKSNIFQTIGFKVWDYIDPLAPKSRNDIRHNIKPFSSFGDL